jgi:hypothetical protein
MKYFQAAILTLLVTAGINSSYASVTNGLVAYYPLNSSAQDASGSELHGFFVGTNYIASNRFGVAASAHGFDGGNMIASNVPIDMSEQFSMSMWMYLERQADGQSIMELSVGTSCTTNPVIFQSAPNLYLVGCGQSVGGYPHFGALQNFLSNWVHIAFVVSNNTTVIYRDGSRLATYARGWPATSLVRLTLASHRLQTFHSRVKLDEVRIYNRSLTSNEVTQLYLDEGGPLAHRMDINFGRAYSILTESNRIYQLQQRDSPFTNLWTSLGSPIYGTGSIAYGFEVGPGPVFLPARRWESRNNTDDASIQFDGVNDFAFTAHDARLNFTNAMTLEAWVNPSSSGSGTLIAKASSPAVICYSLELNAASRPLFRVFNSSGTAFLSITGSTVFTTGQWRHVAAVWNGSTAKILVNGAEVGSGSGVGTTRVSVISSFQLGSIFGSAAFRGCLDQVRVWNVARDDIDIANAYQAVLTGAESGLVGMWRIQAGEEQTFSDSTAEGLHLTAGSDPNPDTNDPVIKPESFPAGATYQEIFDFGVPCMVVGHDSATGALYIAQSGHHPAAPDWANRGVLVTAIQNRVEYLVWPTNTHELFRASSGPLP